MTKNILFISKGINASTRYRALQFFPYLQDNGYSPSHVIASGGLRAICLALWRAKQSDVVVVLRKTFPSVITWLLRRVSTRLIFDFDDAIFCNSNGSASSSRLKRFQYILKQCDHVFAGNQFLVTEALKHNQHVSLIPTCLDVQRYKMEVDKPVEFIDLVWIGSQSTSKYLKNLLPLLEQIIKEIPHLRLKIVADFTVTDIAIPVLAIPWSETGEAEALVSSHIGIAPMVSNDWTRGKCALKVLQYMAAGLPVVSSNIGVNGEAVKEGESGCLVTTNEEWKDALIKLANDDVLRAKMGKAGQERVKQIYDIGIVAKKILGVLG